MQPKERERHIKRLENQFEIHRSYAAYWLALATTGAIVRSNKQRGRDPTEEERAKGMTIGWRNLTPEEKIDDALQTAERHIHHMSDLTDALGNLRREDDDDA